VKTVYEPEQLRPPNVSKYHIKEEADLFVRMCLKYGLSIVSCEVIDEATALALIEEGNVEYDEEEEEDSSAEET